MNKTITLEVNGTDLTFEMTPDAYNKFINEMQPTNKVAPAHSLLMRTVTDDTKDDLKDLLKKPGAALELVGSLVSEYTPDLSIIVGKSKKSPNE
ncbi:putative phage tail assembly chaperone [Pseudodesulfovibrio sediminis]|uniref:Phage protein n=1 Tax=Pseudodesulfovibrio sediminis TaxID=2810563 RepID=A0ABN6EXP8_9BACT|nr:putative phage tail assembly chaperone [Pseudodesulfovibrio sediminis]BCS89965.1 hypothetical protein PSDVSF_32070 [Pseudodesulfovibrio sediminis]